MISGHFFGAIDLASNPASPFSRRVTDLSLLSKNQFFSIWDSITPLAATANIVAGDRGH
jgi:hypothetical protein